MLPEGAHLRESDWTVTFLSNQQLQQADRDMQQEVEKAKEKAIKEGVDPNTLDIVRNYRPDVELQPDGYLCMLNLVRTKMDKSVKRGAVVKAMAIATRHRFYNVFKPLLMLSLDQYFDASTDGERRQILVDLHRTINSLPFDRMPKLSTLQKRVQSAVRIRRSLNPSASDYFVTKVKWGGGGDDHAANNATNSNATAPSTSSTATSNHNPSSSTSTTSSVAAPPTSSPSSSPPAVLPLSIPVSMEQDEVLEASVTTLVNRFREGIMTLYSALLAEKRILFLGYQQPASIVCECVLSACLLISPPIVGTIHRAFPYANLTNMDFLNVPGYIAGVTNPLFEQRSNWWDVLCNISTGEVTLSPAYAEEIAAGHALASSGGSGGGGSNAGLPSATAQLFHMDAREKSALLDTTFFQELISGVRNKCQEEWTRCMFRDLTNHLLLLARDQEVFLFEQQGDSHMNVANQWKHFHHAANQWRIKAFLKSKQYASWMAQQKRFLSQESALKEMEVVVRHHVRTLQVLSVSRHVGASSSSSSSSTFSSTSFPSRSPIPLSELIVLYHDLHNYIHTRDEILELLSMMPESQGGLFPIAMGLLHHHPKIRGATVDLLQRIDAQPEGNRCVSSLNYFLLLTLYRQIKQSGRQLVDYSSDEDGEDAPNGDADTASTSPDPAVSGPYHSPTSTLGPIPIVDSLPIPHQQPASAAPSPSQSCLIPSIPIDGNGSPCADAAAASNTAQHDQTPHLHSTPKASDPASAEPPDTTEDTGQLKASTSLDGSTPLDRSATVASTTPNGQSDDHDHDPPPSVARSPPQVSPSDSPLSSSLSVDDALSQAVSEPTFHVDEQDAEIEAKPE